MARSRLACDPEGSRGRFHVERPGDHRGPRDAFQRDRDRIIHSVPFRRLRHKTQVFVAPDGDHFRVRLTHSIEVAQIGRTIARALGLNEDLTEALCLAHDIGHPPFGHAGEDALQAAMAEVGGFDHNGHSLRLLTRLETPYPLFDGLNLTWETLEGLAKHNGPVESPGWALAEADAEFPLDLGKWPGLEAQVAAIADDIAYDNHDVDDGLRAGLFTLEQVLEIPWVAEAWAGALARFPECPPARLVPELIRESIGRMVHDVLEESRARTEGIADLAGVRGAGRALVTFSSEVGARERELKAFLHSHMYDAPPVQAIRRRSHQVIAGLFEAYAADPQRLPQEWRESHERAIEPRRTVGDFIAGMTDRFAIRCYRDLIGPIDLPEGF